MDQIIPNIPSFDPAVQASMGLSQEPLLAGDPPFLEASTGVSTWAVLSGVVIGGAVVGGIVMGIRWYNQRREVKGIAQQAAEAVQSVTGRVRPQAVSA